MDVVYWVIVGCVMLIFVAWLWSILTMASRADDALELDKESIVLAAEDRD